MRLIIDLQGAQGSNHARGIGRYTRELALAMARAPRGHDVAVALNGALPETAAALREAFAGVLPPEAIHVWQPPRGNWTAEAAPLRAYGEELRARFLHSLRPDIVHVTSLFEGQADDALTLLPQGVARPRVVATCYDLIPLIRHQDYFGAGEEVSPFAQWYYRRVQEMALCDGLLAISDSSREEAIHHLPFPPGRVFNVQAGISPAFRPVALTPEARAALLRRLGLRGSFILFLGAGDLRKNEGGLLAAYARLPRALQDRHQLLLVGAPDEARLQREAARLGVPAGRVVVLRHVAEQDLNALYSATALFVFPSLHEGFGLPLAEAMACGAPSIASNCTSMPEVLGRDDATFDPTDPTAIAATMQRVLEDDGLRAGLAAHALAQAARFTWQSSADRAWNALEAIEAVAPARPAPAAPARPSLAFVSPLPPQASGIADYAAELLPALAQHYDITLVTEAVLRDPRLAGGFARLTPEDFVQQAARFDRVLYQVGNSDFHTFQIEELLPRCPGVVVLHDAFLSNYVNWLVHHQGRPDHFREVLLRAHGYPALRLEADQGRDAAVTAYPCCLMVLQKSVAVIQHSEHGRDVLRAHFGERATRDIAIVPLLRSSRPLPDRAAARAALGLGADEWVVCSFGGVTPLKCPVLLAEAWRQSRQDGRLVFAGSVEEPLRLLVEDRAANISCTGRLSREQYDQWLAAADVAVQWRAGSRGESSAAVTDVLMAGLPTVVNRHGTAVELPQDAVLAMPDEADAAALAGALLALRADPARRAALSAAGRRHVAEALAPAAAALRYRAVIEGAYAGNRPQLQAARMAARLHAACQVPGGGRAALQALARSFPSPWVGGGHPRLLIDISELARKDWASGIQRVVRELARRVLEAPPDGYRGDVVRTDAGHVRHSTAIPLALLGHPPLDLPEAPLDGMAGDILLCADINSALTGEEFAELQRLRLQGVRVILVVYDLLPLRHPELFPPGITVVQDWYTRMLSIADGAACISRAVADDLLGWLDEHPQTRAAALPVGVFHLGADFRAVPAGETSSAAVQAALEAAGRRPTVLMAGTVEPRKGYAQALAAFEALWAAGEDIGLTIVGKRGWQMEELAARLQATARGNPRLHWLDNCPDADLQRLYGKASGLLMASGHEGFGLPIIEAAQAGLPVLARDLPVFREVAGEHAAYFQGQEPAALADAVRNWVRGGFQPAPAGIRPLSWDDSYRQLCEAVLGEDWHAVWRPPAP